MVTYFLASADGRPIVAGVGMLRMVTQFHDNGLGISSARAVVLCRVLMGEYRRLKALLVVFVLKVTENSLDRASLIRGHSNSERVTEDRRGKNL
jgi:hypothetical protein